MATKDKVISLPLFDEFQGWITSTNRITPQSFAKYCSAFNTCILKNETECGLPPFAALSVDDFQKFFCTVYPYYLKCNCALSQKFTNTDGTSRVPPQNGNALSLFEYYLEYILTISGPTISMSFDKSSDIPYLNDIIQNLAKAGLEPTAIFECLTNISLPQKQEDLRVTIKNRKKKLSPYGIAFYSILKILLIRWTNEPEILHQTLADNLPKIAQDELRDRIYQFSNSLNNMWKNIENYRGSGTQQLILQLISRNNVNRSDDPSNDFFDQEEQSYLLDSKISKWLIQLLIEQINNNGLKFSESYITEADFHSLDEKSVCMLLALSPFQQTDFVESVKLKNNIFKYQSELASSLRISFQEFTTPFHSLIQRGFLWIEHKNRAQYLRITPLPYKLSHHPASAQISSVWNEENHTFFLLLNLLLEETRNRQKDLLQQNDKSDLTDYAEFNCFPELDFILRSAPKSITAPDRSHINARRKKDVTALLDAAQQYLDSSKGTTLQTNWTLLLDKIDQLHNHENQHKYPQKGMYEAGRLLIEVLACCYGMQLLRNSPADIVSGRDSLLQLWKIHSDNAIYTVNNYLCSVLPYTPSLFTENDLHLLTAFRLLETVETEYNAAADDRTQEKQTNWHRYLVFAESAALDVRQKDYGDDRTLAINSACLRIKSLALQYRIAMIDDCLTIIRNFALPCLKELVYCQEILFAGSIVDPDHIKAISTAIGIYQNEDFHKLKLNSLDPLAFNLITEDGNTALQYIKQLQSLIAEYEKALVTQTVENIPGSSGSAPSTAIWTKSSEGISTGRKFYQYWYLSGLDSVVVSENSNAKDNAKRYIMRHLLEAQHIVLPSNQILDSACIRELAHDSSFLWALKTGRITVSLFGSSDSLTDFAAILMNRTYDRSDVQSFKWSSLPDSLNQDSNLRRAIADCLSDPLNSAKRRSLPDELRNHTEQFIEDIRILNEAIPHFHRFQRFQRGKTPNMMELLDTRMKLIEAEENFPNLYNLQTAIQDYFKNQNINAVRTDYLNILKYLKNPNASSDEIKKLATYRSFLDVHINQEWISDQAALDSAVFEVNDVYNSMLANKFAQMKEFIYTPQEQLFIPYKENIPLSDGGCKKYGLMHNTDAKGSSLGFSDVTRICMDIQHILSKNPLAEPSQIIRDLQLNSSDPLSYTELAYPDGVVLRLEHVSTKVDNQVHTHTLADPLNTGIAYTEFK